MRIRVKRIDDAVPVPAYATEGAAGLDLCADMRWTILPRQIVRVPTGVCVEIPPGYEGQVRPRSGLASQGVVAILGTIDSDYRGEIHVLLENRGLKPVAIEPCMRIAQLVIAPVARVEVEVVEELSPTERGAHGFGSTGVWAMAPRTEAPMRRLWAQYWIAAIMMLGGLIGMGVMGARALGAAARCQCPSESRSDARPENPASFAHVPRSGAGHGVGIGPGPIADSAAARESGGNAQ